MSQSQGSAPALRPEVLKRMYDRKYKFCKERLHLPEKRAQRWAREYVELVQEMQ